MKPVRVYYDPVDAPRTWFDVAIEWLLGALLIFCPIAFGAVEAWSEQVVITLSSLIALCLCVKLLLRPDARFVSSWTFLPIILFLALVALQLIPLPATLLQSVSRNTADLKAQLLSALPSIDLRRMTLTFYAEPGWRQIGLLLSAATIFVAVMQLGQRIESLKRILVIIASVGGAMAVLALAQDISGATAYYWIFPTGRGMASSGPFVNHSHFSQFMNLSMGAALALILLHWQRDHSSADREFAARGRLPVIPVLVLMFCCGAAAIVISQSRMGAFSMVIATIITAPLVAAKTRTKGLGFVVILTGLIVFAVVCYVGSNAVFERFAAAGEASVKESRLQMVRDLAKRAWPKFPVFGTGLGTFGFVFPMFEQSPELSWAMHADDEYAQLMTENGINGVAMLLLFLGVVAANYFRCIKGGLSRSGAGAIALGMGYGLIAILIHSASDYGQHIPANVVLTAISCAMIIAAARLRKLSHLNQPPGEFRGSIGLRAVSAVIVLPLLALLLWDANRARLGERYWNLRKDSDRYLAEHDWKASDEVYLDVLNAATRAAELRPGNVEYRYWLNVYRWEELDRLRDATGAWPVEYEQQALQFTRQIVDDLQHCRPICPTYGPLYTQMGQLQQFVLNDPTGAQNIRRGFELNRNDPNACFIAGRLAASERDWSTAQERFRRCVELQPSLQREVTEVLLGDFKRADLALDLVHGDLRGITDLLALAQRYQVPDQTLAAAKSEQESLVREQAKAPDAGRDVLLLAARYAAGDQDYPAAVNYYRRALARDYTATDIRFELAQTLVKAGDRDGATREVEMCLQQRPNWAEAEQLLKELRGYAR
jgi:tetratricopeptide (TPR) repeat protein